MKSHADEINDFAVQMANESPQYTGEQYCYYEAGLARQTAYAKGLEFALECISKGMKLPNSDFTCPHCTNPKPHIHTAAEEAKLVELPAASRWHKLSMVNSRDGGWVELRFYDQEIGYKCSARIEYLLSPFEIVQRLEKFTSLIQKGYKEALPVVEEEFHTKHGPGNPCGKPFCVLCYPDGPGGQPKEDVNSDGPC
jgi:hypothetical protein